MYKRKLLYFGLTTAIILLISLTYTAFSANITRKNLKQSTLAQSLHIEYQHLSSFSYKLFKQLTDEVIFDQYANQADVRNKEDEIKGTLITIKQMAQEQRTALGQDMTHGSIKEVEELEKLIELIIKEFRAILATSTNTPLREQERLRSLLESTIDNEFREIINNALSRQSRVVASINARIDTLNTTILWLTVALGALSLLLVVFASYWLFNQLYEPLVLIKNATKAISSGDYEKPINDKLDDEFQDIANSINQLAKRLQDHEALEVSSRKRLKYEVEQRTSELTKVNLKLTKIDARRRQFISDISHELRTPLTIIRGEAQVTLRLQSASEEDYKTTLNSVLEQSINLSRLVDDLLFITRAEMNQIQLDIVETDISKLIITAIKKWQRLYPARKISLISKPALVEAKCMLDPSRMQQVLSILIDNAIKYSEASKPIDIYLNENDGFFIIEVKDCGSGISATEIENVFERFVRFSKHSQGLGLGLPIAKYIIEAHGGYISVESVIDEGSIFSLKVPKINT